MSPSRIVLGAMIGWLFSLLSATSLSHAQQIYKTVDENGVVSYSTIPHGGDQAIESLDALPEPSPEDVAAAQARLEALRDSTRKIQERRAERQALEAPESVDQDNATAPTGGTDNPLPKLAPLPSIGSPGF